MGLFRLARGYSFSVSFGRPIHPRSGKGWEGENREQLKRETRPELNHKANPKPRPNAAADSVIDRFFDLPKFLDFLLSVSVIESCHV
jgi:hypothetical protein